MYQKATESFRHGEYHELIDELKACICLGWNTAKSERDYPQSSLSGKRIGSQATVGFLREFNPIALDLFKFYLKGRTD